jgi:hypothetical protein
MSTLPEIYNVQPSRQNKLNIVSIATIWLCQFKSRAPMGKRIGLPASLSAIKRLIV